MYCKFMAIIVFSAGGVWRPWLNEGSARASAILTVSNGGESVEFKICIFNQSKALSQDVKA